MIRTILTAATLAAAAVCAAPAMAQDQDAVTIKVAYSDLNLASTAGAAVLQRRIDAAVTQICGRVEGYDLQRTAAIVRCRREVSAGPSEEGRQAIAKAHQTVLASAPQPTPSTVR
jgi:UrcA family protein